MIREVQIHSLVHLNVADTLAHDPNNQFGILWGNVEDSIVKVEGSFELIFANLLVDQQFLKKRIGQFKGVSPNLNIVGLYHIRDSLEPNSLTTSVLEQITSIIPIVIYTIVDGSRLKSQEALSENHLFRSFSVEGNRKLGTLGIGSSTETVSASTSTCHQDYSNESNVKQEERDIGSSVEELHKKVSNILMYLENPDAYESSDHSKINRAVSRLSNKVSAFKSGHKYSGNDTQLLTTHLHLLTQSFAAVETVKDRTDQAIFKYVLTPESEKGLENFI